MLLVFCSKIIRDRIIPHAISLFTREALEEGGEFEDLQGDDSDDEAVEYYEKMWKPDFECRNVDSLFAVLIIERYQNSSPFLCIHHIRSLGMARFTLLIAH